MIYLVDRKETAAAGFFAASVSEVLKSHARNVFITKFKSFLVNGKTFKPYSKTDKHICFSATSCCTVMHRLQVRIQLHTYADDVALPTFARNTPLLQQSIYISCPPGPQQQTCSSGFAAVG